MTAPVFVADDLTAAAPGAVLTLDGPEGRHAVSVRRLRVGEEVVLTDGAGRGAYGTVAAVEGKDRLDVAVAEVRDEAAPAPRITVVQALPKGDRGELAVETMTETGVDAVVPWQAARCITQWRGDRGAKSLAKWRATAREAGKQSRRLRFPEVADAASTAQVARMLAEADFAAVLHEEGAEPRAPPPRPGGGGGVGGGGPRGGGGPGERAP
ncbi:16S rRNA (uracil(1498)-N(3))-methyltransferase, partial [Streptomyces fradiae]|uniref:16S rRNA (uracil(1498)-N(3))-methyltransferase n=1 Tax=Streptomyces fradiae TaxID=1906 RepID=UPI00368D019E